MLWQTLVIVNRLTSYQECRKGVLGPIMVPPVHLIAFCHLENKKIGYADDSTLIAIVPPPGIMSYSSRDPEP